MPCQLTLWHNLEKVGESGVVSCGGMGWDFMLLLCYVMLCYVMFTRQHDAISQVCMLYYIVFLPFTLHHF
jgi:hypothetical protein